MDYDQKLCDYLVKRFKLKGWLLDVGCGDGKHVRAFQQGLSATGIDKPNCDLEKDSIPFPDNTFDVVFCKSVLEHIKNDTHVKREIYRVLKRGGLAIFMTPLVNKHWYTYPEHINELAARFAKDGELFYQFPWVWKYPWLKIVCKLIAWLVPDRYRFRKDGTQRVLIRHSKEPMWLLWARK